MGPKKWFPFKLPRILKFVFSPQELPAPKISNETDAERRVCFDVDRDTGKLDMNTLPVPPQFREQVQQLYENIYKPKFVMKIEEKAQDEVVEKGLKDEEIIGEMRSLVVTGDPWNVYNRVNDVRIPIFCCFDHYQAWLKHIEIFLLRDFLKV